MAPSKRVLITQPASVGKSVSTSTSKGSLILAQSGRDESKVIGKRHPFRQREFEFEITALRIVVVFVVTVPRRLGNDHKQVVIIISGKVCEPLNLFRHGSPVSRDCKRLLT